MIATVNIGLDANNGTEIRPHHALAALRAIGGVKTLMARVLQSDTEPTLVAEVTPPLTATAAYAVAERLHQDCIAQWDGREGALYGPNAHAWGTFNPAFFVTLDGHRLEPELVLADALGT